MGDFGEAHRAAKFHRQHGRPEVAATIDAAIRADDLESLDPAVLRTDGTSPAKAVALDVTPPARHGKTSEWRTYAKKVSDIEDEVIDGLGREDLVTMLKANGIIPRDYGESD